MQLYNVDDIGTCYSSQNASSWSVYMPLGEHSRLGNGIECLFIAATFFTSQSRMKGSWSHCIYCTGLVNVTCTHNRKQGCSTALKHVDR